MIQDLIKNLVSEAGVDETQAAGGAGLLFKLAKDKLSSGDFSSVTSALGGGVEDLISKAPAAGEESSGGGIAGMLGSVASMAGIGGLGSLGALAGGFKALNLDASSITKFVPVVLGFVQSKGGDQAKSLLEGVFGGK